jgi:hypothetical protein
LSENFADLSTPARSNRLNFVFAAAIPPPLENQPSHPERMFDQR